MDNELIVMQGYPASGKSSEARRLLDERENAAIVCRDDLRFMMHGTYWSGDSGKEAQVTIAEQAAVERLLIAGTIVIIDATNLIPDKFQRWIATASLIGVQLKRVRVPTPAEECILRDNERRQLGRRAVGADVIRRMAQEFPEEKWP